MLDGMSEESSEIGLPSTDVTSIDSDDKDLGTVALPMLIQVLGYYNSNVLACSKFDAHLQI